MATPPKPAEESEAPSTVPDYDEGTEQEEPRKASSKPRKN